MLNFELYIPTKLYFGRGQCGRVGEIAAGRGFRRALICYGGGSAAAVKIEPIGFLVVKDDGVRMINVAPPAKNGVDRIIDLVPDVMDKIESIANTNKKTD